MATAATIQAKIDRGYGLAARRLGIDTDAYRPAGAGNPLVIGNKFGTLKMAITNDPAYGYTKPGGYGSALEYGLIDGSTLRVGDYLTRADRRTGAGDGGTWFVASLGLHLQIVLIKCEAVVTVTRPGGQAPSDAYYGGPTVAGETAVLTGWPASVLMRGSASRGEVALPGDTPMTWHAVLLPYGGIAIRQDDVITTADTPPRRFTVSGVELTGMGWRLTAMTAFP